MMLVSKVAEPRAMVQVWRSLSWAVRKCSCIGVNVLISGDAVKNGLGVPVTTLVPWQWLVKVVGWKAISRKPIEPKGALGVSVFLGGRIVDAGERWEVELFSNLGMRGRLSDTIPEEI